MIKRFIVNATSIAELYDQLPGEVVDACDYANLEARIEKLEAALRDIDENEFFQACSAGRIARAALESKSATPRGENERIAQLEVIARDVYNDFKKEAWEGANEYFKEHPEVNKHYGSPKETACEHEWGEYSIDNAKSPADPPERYVWIKCIKCGEPQAATSNRTVKP